MERKSCWSLILCLIILVITGLVGNIHINKEFVNKLTNEVEFSERKERQKDLDIKDYSLAIEHTQKEIDSVDKEVKELQDEVGKLNTAKEEKDKEVKACKDSVAVLSNDVAAVEKEKSDIEGNFGVEKTKWSEEMNGLKQKLQNQSLVCAFVNATADVLKDEPTIKDLCPQIQTTVQVTVKL
ncbi:myosin-2 heavy chain, non muscle [Carassius gibelio]|uniref:myosin-2 heavy chain, non muscle n=1 Tax=Carassius gibelio TaxID=101364 RepID=UPI002278E8C1|nr:myosin-2 heavy chain, non muscle [Carassius gibelio]